MKEKIMEATEIGKEFCEGAALGAVTALITLGYDGLIRSLPLPVRLVTDTAVATGCHILGLKALEKIHD